MIGSCDLEMPGITFEDDDPVAVGAAGELDRAVL